jgi:hypothetical protein
MRVTKRALQRHRAGAPSNQRQKLTGALAASSSVQKTLAVGQGPRGSQLHRRVLSSRAAVGLGRRVGACLPKRTHALLVAPAGERRRWALQAREVNMLPRLALIVASVAINAHSGPVRGCGFRESADNVVTFREDAAASKFILFGRLEVHSPKTGQVATTDSTPFGSRSCLVRSLNQLRRYLRNGPLSFRPPNVVAPLPPPFGSTIHPRPTGAGEGAPSGRAGRGSMSRRRGAAYAPRDRPGRQ